MSWVAFIALCYLGGAGLGWYRGPIAVMSDAVSRHRSRRSDGDMTDEDDPDDECNDTAGEGLDDRERTVSFHRYGRGPRPVDELLDELDDEDEDDDEDWTARMRWVAEQLAAGRRPTDVDAAGAERFGVTQRTIARDRETLARRGRGGTMRGTR